MSGSAQMLCSTQINNVAINGISIDCVPTVYQPRQPFLVCYLEPIGSGGDHWNCFRLSARSGHAQQQPPTHPRGVELGSRDIPNQITNRAEDTNKM